MNTVPIDLLEPYFRTTALGLRILDTREARPRRFGPDADSAWRTFSRDLSDRDRLDLLARDAAARFAAAAAPRLIFQLEGLTDDEPFGPSWPGAPDDLARGLLREGASLPTTADAVLTATVKAWSLRAKPLAGEVSDGIGPATRIIVAGAGAMVSIARAFTTKAGLDLSDQVVFIADAPGERQLAGVIALLVDVPRPIRLLDSSGATASAVRAAGLHRVDLLAISDDADERVREAATSLSRALGG